MEVLGVEISEFSKTYQVRRLGRDDVDAIYELCRENRIFYRYHEPFVTKESILDDMEALPPGKSREDKYYVGFFDGWSLVAIMDLILAISTKNIIALITPNDHPDTKLAEAACIEFTHTSLRHKFT